MASSSSFARPGEAIPLTILPFIALHLLALFAFQVGVTWELVAWAAGLYAVRMWGVTAGYHRYFSHRTFKTSRVFQFVLAFIAQTSIQKGALWWASHHRHHHRFSDTEADVHSPVQHGFWWSHVGWIMPGSNDATRLENVKDLARYPELRFLDRFHWLPSLLLGVALFAIGGWPVLVWGLFVSTVFLWHGTFIINSLAHVFGSRRFATTDDSRNNLLFALITLGEGWHNNHHHYQSSCRQGFYWWEVDVTYYVLKALETVGLVWEVREPPAHVLEAGRVARAKPVVAMPPPVLTAPTAEARTAGP